MSERAVRERAARRQGVRVLVVGVLAVGVLAGGVLVPRAVAATGDADRRTVTVVVRSPVRVVDDGSAGRGPIGVQEAQRVAATVCANARDDVTLWAGGREVGYRYTSPGPASALVRSPAGDDVTAGDLFARGFGVYAGSCEQTAVFARVPRAAVYAVARSGLAAREFSRAWMRRHDWVVRLQAADSTCTVIAAGMLCRVPPVG